MSESLLNASTVAKHLARHAGAALACMVLAAGVESLNAFWRQADIDEAARENSNVDVGLALAEQTQGMVEEADAALDKVAKAFAPYARDGRFERPLAGLAAIASESGLPSLSLSQVSAVDAKGMLRASSLPMPKAPIDLSGREHIAALLGPGAKAGAPDALFIGQSVLGKLSHAWTIQLSRRVVDADGSTLGAAVASLGVERLHALYSRVDLGAGSIVTLAGPDGIARARVEDGRPAGLGEPAAEASCSKPTIACAIPDGSRRRNVFASKAAVGGTGMSVVVAQGESAVLEDGRQRSAVSRLFALISCLCIGLLSWRSEKMSRARSANDTNKRASEDFAVGASRGKARFLNNLGQTLRAPAADIAAMADLALADASLTPFAKECIQSSKASAQSLMGLLSKVSDMTAIESGRLAMVKSRFDLGELALLCLREAQASQDPPIEIEHEGLGSLPKDHWGDPARARQILLELLDAARAASASAKLKAVASLAGGHALIEILAVGSAPGALGSPALQDPLSQDSPSASGLGLSLCGRLAALMGGDLALSDSPEGARLRLMLPLSPRAES